MNRALSNSTSHRHCQSLVMTPLQRRALAAKMSAAPAEAGAAVPRGCRSAPQPVLNVNSRLQDPATEATAPLIHPAHEDGDSSTKPPADGTDGSLHDAAQPPPQKESNESERIRSEDSCRDESEPQLSEPSMRAAVKQLSSEPASPSSTWRETGCSYCRKLHAAKLVCGRCKAVNYCSRQCQRNDWACHKPSCTPPSASGGPWPTEPQLPTMHKKYRNPCNCDPSVCECDQGYVTVPALHVLRRMSLKELGCVRDFKVIRPGFGKLEWQLPVNLIGADLDNVTIAYR